LDSSPNHFGYVVSANSLRIAIFFCTKEEGGREGGREGGKQRGGVRREVITCSFLIFLLLWLSRGRNDENERVRREGGREEGKEGGRGTNKQTYLLVRLLETWDSGGNDILHGTHDLID